MTERMLQRNAPALRYWDQRGAMQPPVMLIHGVGADGNSWDQIAPASRRTSAFCASTCAGMAGRVTSTDRFRSMSSFRM